jgi:hypothetical protein
VNANYGFRQVIRNPAFSYDHRLSVPVTVVFRPNDRLPVAVRQETCQQLEAKVFYLCNLSDS